MMMRSKILCVLTLSCCTSPFLFAAEPAWERVELDAAFRSEGVAVADIDRDGKLDVIAGDVWYQAPEWTMHAFRPVGEFVAGKGYSNSFANFTFDVNRDGWDDIIVIGFPGEPFYWYENPQRKETSPDDANWKEHLIWHSACNESPEFEDVDGDGVPELVVGSQPERQMGYLRVPPKEKPYRKWEFVPVSEPGDPAKNGTFKYYHGLGVDDVDGDGREDIMIPHGWWQAPEDRTQTPWTFHAWNLGAEGSGNPQKSANMYTQDFDGDGDHDVIMSSAHTYGVWWFELPEGKMHLIDDSYSQTHAMERADIDGDGDDDYVTGKRYYAHNGRDPGGKDAVVMRWYEHRNIDGKVQFIGHEIEAGRGTGVGTQFMLRDMNADGKVDIVLSNKSGVNLLLQK